VIYRWFLFGKILLSLFRAGMTWVHRKLRTPGIRKSFLLFLLPESRKAYRDRITFTRKKGRWRAIAESKMAGSGLQQMRQTVKQLGCPVIENPGLQIPVLRILYCRGI
jgi:hypothetical protein